MRKQQLSGSVEPGVGLSPERVEDKKGGRGKLLKDFSPESHKIESKIHSPAKKKTEGTIIKEDEPQGPPEIYLHRNPQGGIYVHEKDIETLFHFIDSGNYGRITMQDLKKKVSLFAKEMTSRDFKFLMAGKNMSLAPVAMSMTSTFMSATTLLGWPTEMYTKGNYIQY